MTETALAHADTILTHALVVTVDDERRVISDGAVAIRGDKIAAVGKTDDVLATWTADDIRDASRFVITPGLINTHVHITGEPLTRGFVPDDTPFLENVFEWLTPIHTFYTEEDERISAQLAALEMLNILEGYDVKSLGHNSAEYLHLLVEAKKLAFVDRAKHIGDPAFYQAPLAQLLSKDYAAEMRKKINLGQAQEPTANGPQGGEDTVYLTVVDKDRNCVSFIQSIFSLFGSGLVAGDTGIILHNRGAGFSFNPNAANKLEGGKRPFHTLIPAMVFQNDKPWLTFGVMGGDMQAQGHVQVLMNMIDFGMDVQQAGEQPRFRHFENGLALESALGADIRKALEAKGHKLTTATGAFGGYQAIMIDPATGALAGGSDVRKDGCAIGW